jgi:hypothetical protein
MIGMAMTTTVSRMLIWGSIVAGLCACAKEPPPPSVSQFLDDRILLEATMMRCAEDRLESRYKEECLNARDAVDRIEAAEAATRSKELEAQSERKRNALRRAQEAAAEARRRAAEAERLRQEAELLGRYPAEPGEAGDAPEPRPRDDTDDTPEPPSGESAAPATEQSPGVASDLGAVREELRRRQQDENRPRD